MCHGEGTGLIAEKRGGKRGGAPWILDLKSKDLQPNR
jgi:hypothetical protein